MAIQTRDETGEDEYVFAIGVPYAISVADETEETVESFDDTPITLDISYTPGMLRRLYRLMSDFDIYNIKIYLYDELTDSYKCVGGTVDPVMFTVSTDITCSGQYILAYDSDAPIISMFTVRNSTAKPEFSVCISDIGGIDKSSIVVKLDNSVIIDKNNVDEHYSDIGFLLYTSDKEVAAGNHTVMIIVADTFGNFTTQEYVLNVDTGLPVISSFDVQEGQDSIIVKAEINDNNISGVYAAYSINNNGEWMDEVYNEMSIKDDKYTCTIPTFSSNARICVVAYDTAGNIAKTDYYTINPSISIGDLNSDGKINTADAVYVLKASAGMIQLDENQLSAGDCNHDGKVNTADAVLILKYAAGMIEKF